MSEETEDRIRDWALWYTEHKKNIPEENIKAQNEFLRMACDGLLEIMAMLAKDIQICERRNGRASLWLPSSVKLDNGPPVRLR